jgi:hypothetical protein
MTMIVTAIHGPEVSGPEVMTKNHDWNRSEKHQQIDHARPMARSAFSSAGQRNLFVYIAGTLYKFNFPIG